MKYKTSCEIQKFHSKCSFRYILLLFLVICLFKQIQRYFIAAQVSFSIRSNVWKLNVYWNYSPKQKHHTKLWFYFSSTKQNAHEWIVVRISIACHFVTAFQNENRAVFGKSPQSVWHLFWCFVVCCDILRQLIFHEYQIGSILYERMRKYFEMNSLQNCLQQTSPT